jgi:hypothetical protein
MKLSKDKLKFLKGLTKISSSTSCTDILIRCGIEPQDWHCNEHCPIFDENETCTYIRVISKAKKILKEVMLEELQKL